MINSTESHGEAEQDERNDSETNGEVTHAEEKRGDGQHFTDTNLIITKWKL